MSKKFVNTCDQGQQIELVINGFNNVEIDFCFCWFEIGFILGLTMVFHLNGNTYGLAIFNWLSKTLSKATWIRKKYRILHNIYIHVIHSKTDTINKARDIIRTTA